MGKTIFTLAVLCGIMLLSRCKGGNSKENTIDTTAVGRDRMGATLSKVTKMVETNQYDSEGRKTGHWEYMDESTGWFCVENYVEGVLDGSATYYNEELLTIEMNYCKGIECGEMHIFDGTKGDTGIRLSDITKVDTIINGNIFHYRAHCKTNDVYKGIYSNEGTCYYEDQGGLLVDGFLGVGEWIVYDRDGKTIKTVTLDKPTADFNIK